MLDRDVEELNRDFLMLVREACRSHSEEAAWRFGVEPSAAQALAELTREQIGALARSARPVLALRLDGDLLSRILPEQARVAVLLAEEASG